MGIYAVTAWSKDMGWRDIQVTNAGDMHEAIALAEKVSGCRVSHGRGGPQPDFDPGLIIDAESGEVSHPHNRKAKPVVVAGPPDVIRAIAQAMKPAPKAPSRRKVNRAQPDPA